MSVVVVGGWGITGLPSLVQEVPPKIDLRELPSSEEEPRQPFALLWATPAHFIYLAPVQDGPFCDVIFFSRYLLSNALRGVHPRMDRASAQGRWLCPGVKHREALLGDREPEQEVMIYAEHCESSPRA
jgi:hypothetical protein